MSTSFSLFIRLILGLLGGICLFIGTFFREGEDGRLQSLLESLWIRIDDIQRHTVSRHISFLNVVAQVLGSRFDTIFGPALVSFQSIGVSVCYGLASDALFYILIIYQRRFVGFTDPLVATLLLYLALGSILNLYQSRVSRLIWFLIFLFVLWRVTIGPDVTTSYSLYSEGYPANLVFFPLEQLIRRTTGVVLFTSSVVLIRFCIKQIEHARSSRRIVTVALINSIPLTIQFGLMTSTASRLVGFVVRGVTHLIPALTTIKDSLLATYSLGIFFAAGMNLPLVLSDIAFLLLAVILIAHRLSWSFMDRPVYALQRAGIAGRSKFLRRFGASLISLAVIPSSWVEKLVAFFHL
jgi:hypothetical protein